MKEIFPEAEERETLALSLESRSGCTTCTEDEIVPNDAICITP